MLSFKRLFRLKKRFGVEVHLNVQLIKINTRSSAIAVIADRTACSILTLFIVTATS